MIRSTLFSMRRFMLLALLLGIMAGCAAPGKIRSDADSYFQRTGRFAISVNTFSGAQDAVQGGFAWLDTGQNLVLDLANPLGSTLARVTVADNIATLTHSNGTQESAPHADALVEKVLGSPVPVEGLRYWLQCQTGTDTAQDIHKDAETGQLAEFTQQGWRVKLSRYDKQGPTLLQMNRRDSQRDISVRLAISAQQDMK